MVEIPDPDNWDMIVFDVDGTLLDREGFHEDLVKLARRVDREVMPVSLASGRTLPNVTPIMQAIGASGFIVAENGGMVWDSGQVMKFWPFPMGEGRRKRQSGWLRKSMIWTQEELSQTDGERLNGALVKPIPLN